LRQLSYILADKLDPVGLDWAISCHLGYFCWSLALYFLAQIGKWIIVTST